MKRKELSEKGLDTSHIEQLSKQIAELKKKKEILENKDNILFYGKYKEFVNEYSKKDYYDNQLKLAKEIAPRQIGYAYLKRKSLSGSAMEFIKLLTHPQMGNDNQDDNDL